MIAYGTNYGRGKYGYYGVRGNDVTGPFGNFYNAFGNMYAFYLQDSWTIANRFTLNFGLRAETENIPSFARPIPTEGHGRRSTSVSATSLPRASASSGTSRATPR